MSLGRFRRYSSVVNVHMRAATVGDSSSRADLVGWLVYLPTLEWGGWHRPDRITAVSSGFTSSNFEESGAILNEKRLEQFLALI